MVKSTFYFNNGQTASNMKGLIKVLSTSGDEIYNYHVNADRNDFYNWIKEGLNHPEVAEAIKGASDREHLIKKLKCIVKAK